MNNGNSIADMRRRIATLMWDISVIGNEKLKARKRAELDELVEQCKKEEVN